jgi:DNA (cytosine-5)-methyltransferase 1
VTANLDREIERRQELKAKHGNGNGAGTPLAVAVRMWHTPTASDKDGKPRWDHRASPGYVRAKPVPNLMAQVMERWPTPRAQNGEPRNAKVWRRPDGEPQNLENAVASEDPAAIGGSLNPTWVEWLMGFPLGWTDLGPSETRSSRKSSSSSAGASSKRKR